MVQLWNFGAVLGELFWMLRIRKWGHGWEIVRMKVPFTSMVDENDGSNTNLTFVAVTTST